MKLSSVLIFGWVVLTSCSKTPADQTSETFPIRVTSVNLERTNGSLPPTSRKDAKWELVLEGNDWDVVMDSVFDQTRVNEEVSLRTYIALKTRGSEKDLAFLSKMRRKFSEKPRPAGASNDVLTFFGRDGRIFVSDSSVELSGRSWELFKGRLIREGTKTESTLNDELD